MNIIYIYNSSSNGRTRPAIKGIDWICGHEWPRMYPIYDDDEAYPAFVAGMREVLSLIPIGGKFRFQEGKDNWGLFLPTEWYDRVVAWYNSADQLIYQRIS